MAILTISNVNHENEELLNDIAGLAGYAGAVERVDLCTARIDLLDGKSRAKLGILDTELLAMVAAYAEAGFRASIAPGD